MAYLCPHPCDGKTEYGYCRYTGCINPLHSNLGTAYQGQGVQIAIITNADRIRSMTDEELAEWIVTVPLSHDDICPSPLPEKCGGANGYDAEACKKCWLDWLQKEVSDGDS